MSDPHPCSTQPELPTVVPVPEHPGYAIHLNQADLERMAVITTPRERTSIVLGVAREAVLAEGSSVDRAPRRQQGQSMTGSLIQLAHGSDDPWIDTEIVDGAELRPFRHAAGEGQHPA